MNFIAHYHFTHKADAHYHNLGTVLPDLTRNFSPGTRIQPHKVKHLLQQPAHHELNEGSQLHYELDKVFHNSRFFSEAYAFVKATTAQAGYDNSFQKFFFLNHIFLELMLDRFIISNIPAAVDGFYHSIAQVQEPVLMEYLNLHGPVETANFMDKFNRFRQIQYLYYYTDNERMVYSLNRIIMRTGLPGLSSHNQLCTENCILAIAEWMQEAFPELEREMQLQLN